MGCTIPDKLSLTNFPWGVPASQRKSANRPVVAAFGLRCKIVEEATLGFPDVAPQSDLRKMGDQWNMFFLATTSR